MSGALDLVELEHGRRFGRLRVLGKADSKNHNDRYKVGCECGNSSNVVSKGRLVRGVVTECTRCSKRRAHWGISSAATSQSVK